MRPRPLSRDEWTGASAAASRDERGTRPSVPWEGSCSPQRAAPGPAPVDRALDLPAQDPELVAKDEDLDLCGMVGAMVRCDKGEEPTKHQVEE